MGDRLDDVLSACPRVHRVRHELTTQHLRRVEKTAWGQHLPRDHLHRLVMKVQVVRTAVRQGQAEGIAGLATCPTDALQVVGGGRRHRAQHGGRELTDVDAQLQRRRTDEQVRRPGGLRLAFEFLLHPLPLITRQQPGVLLGENSLQPARAVDPPVVTLVVGRIQHKLSRASILRAPATGPPLSVRRRQHDPPAAHRTGYLSNLGGHAEMCRVECPGAPRASSDRVAPGDRRPPGGSQSLGTAR